VEPLEDRILLAVAAPVPAYTPTWQTASSSAASPSVAPPADSSSNDSTPDSSASSSNSDSYGSGTAQDSASTYAASPSQSPASTQASANYTSAVSPAPPTSTYSSTYPPRTSAAQPSYDLRGAYDTRAEYQDSYAPQPQSVSVQPPLAQLAVAVVGQDRPAPLGRVNVESAPVLPAPTVRADALSASVASAPRGTPASLSFAGGQVRPASVAPQEEPPAESAIYQEAEQAHQTVQGQQPEQPAGPLPFELPALEAGGWAQAARRFLAVLEALDANSGDPEAFWGRLGLWSLTAATAFVLFDLGFQHFRKQRQQDLDLAFAQFLEREPS
jgi:hypothetical protein